MTGWTPQMDRALRKAVAAGKTYSMIADELGKSRNACIGRAFRLGINHPSGARHRPSFSHEAALLLLAQGKSVRAVARIFGVSRCAIYYARRVAA